MEIKEGENEYNRVKVSLDSLGYKGKLNIDSVPLVNRILSDLMKATKSFRNMKNENEKYEAELKIQKELILPLRNENLKLVKENNELHKLIIKVKDEIDNNNICNETSSTKLLNTNEELKFLLTQKDATIKTLEIELDSLRIKLNNIFNTLYMGQGDKSRIYMKGLPKANKIISKNKNEINSTFKKASFDLSSRLDMSSELVNNIGSSVPLQMFKDEIITINNKKEEWAKDLKIAESNAEELKTKIDTYQKNIKTRDLEIKRLQEQIYLGDDNKEEIKLKYKSEFMSMQNDKLMLQINFLNKENHRLESIDYFHNHRCRQEEVNRLDEQVAKLTKENEKLQKLIGKANTTNLNMSTFRKSRLSISGASGPSLKSQIENLKKDKADLVKMLEEERQKVQAITKELIDTKNNLNAQISTLLNEKNLLLDKYQKLKSDCGIKSKNDSLDDEFAIKQDLQNLEPFGNQYNDKFDDDANPLL